MLSLSLKKCLCYTQTRQFVTFHTRNRVSVKGRPLNYYVESKYSNITSPNLNVYRLFDTKFSENDGVHIEPLMRQPNAFPSFSPLHLMWTYMYVRLFLDRDLRLLEVCRGCLQAVNVTLQALATQNYEMLEGMIREKSLKVLKHRVNRLTPIQRQVLGIKREKASYVPCTMNIKPTKEGNGQNVEIKVCGFLYGTQYGDVHTTRTNGLYFCYTFERKYINKIGHSWTIKLANHYSIIGMENFLQ